MTFKGGGAVKSSTGGFFITLIAKNLTFLHIKDRSQDACVQVDYSVKERRPMNELAQKKCIPCRGGIPPLKGKELQNFYTQLEEGWKVINEHHIEKEYPFKNFREALDFTNKVGEMAESEGHHPDIHLAWGKVKVILWTHKIDGLTESDFIFAAKTDTIK